MKQKTVFKRLIFKLTAAFALLIAAFSLIFATPQLSVGQISAKASSPSIKVHSYEIHAQIGKDRRVKIREYIDVEFLSTGLTMFYRALPVNGGDRYLDVSAYCPSNPEFSWYVADNPDMSGFIDINCVGGANKGSRYVYELNFTMLPSDTPKEKNGMFFDVVGSGWPVQLNDVDAYITFPAPVLDGAFEIYSSKLGEDRNDYVDTPVWNAERTQVALHADRLPVQDMNDYGEEMAAGISIEFSCGKGVFKPFAATRASDYLWMIILAAVLAGALCVVVVVFCRKKRDIITVVHIKPPDGMDPMRMGKLIDGRVDNEDVTSMIYWFASNGYLHIDMTNERDPLLIKTGKPLAPTAPSYQRVLLDGLFKQGDRVRVSSLKEKYYVHVDKARVLVGAKGIKRYETRSLLGFFGGIAIAIATLVFVPMLIGVWSVGGGYLYYKHSVWLLPAFLAIALLLFYGSEIRYKSPKARKRVRVIAVVVAVVATLVYSFVFNVHVISPVERVVLSLSSFVLVFFACETLSHTEKYVLILGDILGYKDFIVHTEEDKIKVMLEENPELYFDVLPYAQVLGVTNEWENKFKAILIEPPSWATYHTYDVFNYLAFNRCMRNMAAVAYTRPQSSGSSAGRSGGGGSFGGFSGGGHGGGGGGAR